MRLDQTIDTVLAALRDEIGPDLNSDTSRATLRAIMNILAGLSVNAGASNATDGADHPVPFAAEAGGVDIPYRVLGGEAAYRADDAALASGAGDLGALLGRERAALDQVADRTWALLDIPPRAPAAARAAEGRAALETYLRGHTGEDALSVTGFRLLSGGRSKQTALITIAGSIALPEQAVIRQDAVVNSSGGPSVVHEYDLLRLAHGAGVRVPPPLLLEPTGAVLGTPFMLNGRVAGEMASGLLRPPRSPAVALALAGELAKLHAIPFVGPANPAPTRDAMASELETFTQIWRDKASAPCLAMRFALGWLKDNLSLAVEGEACLIHRDPLFHNVLAEGDRFTGLLDWEFARAGYPAEDFGWIRASVEECVDWRDFRNAYRAAGGRPLTSAQLDYYAVWGAARLLAMMAYSNWLAARATEPDIELASVAYHETQIVKRWLSHHVARVAPAG